MFSIFEKIIEKLNFAPNANVSSNKRVIKNKNSPNYGNQVAGDVINQTELTHKSRDDVRRIEITENGNRKYRASAVYVDGVKDENFKVYWYGWQNISGKTPVWTSLGFSNHVELGQSHFISISAWHKDCPTEQSSRANISAEIAIGDKA